MGPVAGRVKIQVQRQTLRPEGGFRDIRTVSVRYLAVHPPYIRISPVRPPYVRTISTLYPHYIRTIFTDLDLSNEIRTISALYPHDIPISVRYSYDIRTISVRYPKRTSAVRPYGVFKVSVRRLYGTYLYDI